MTTKRMAAVLVALAGSLVAAADADAYDVEARGVLTAFPSDTGPSQGWIGGTSGGTGPLMQSSIPYAAALSGTSAQGMQNAVGSGTVALGDIEFASDATSVGNGGNGSLSVALDWSDTLTLVSALPRGTRVDLRFTLLLSGSLGVIGDNDSAAHIQDPGSADIAAYLDPGVQGAQALSIEGGILDGTPFGSMTTAFPAGRYATTGFAGAGTSFDIGSGIESLAEASASNVSASPHSFVDGSARVYVEALTPGVQIVSASGTDFAPPVPEPGARALMVLGLATLAGSAALERRARGRSAPM